MNKVATNLRQLMKAHALSENALARHADVAQPTLHRVLAGGVADPRDRTLRPLATWFGVSVEQLRTELPDLDILQKDGATYRIRRAKGVTVGERQPDIGVAEVTAHIHAGGARPDFDLIATGDHAHYPANWFSDRQLAPAQVRVMAVSGASMERTLFDGDRIAVNLADTRIHDGSVHAFIGSGAAADLRIRRLFTTSDGKLRVVSDNPDKTRYPDELLAAQDVARLVIVGRVVERRGSGGLGL